MTTAAAAVAITAASAGLIGPTAAAEDETLLGGGAGIALGGNSWCTLTTIGHDNAGALVGLTSAHCAGPGAPVTAEGSATIVGSVAAIDTDLDYAVIKFDPTKVTPIPDFAGFPINGLGPNPDLWQKVCLQSRATGNACTLIAGPGPHPGTRTALACGNPDDAGAPVTANGLLIGMVRGGFTPSGGPCPDLGNAVPGWAPIPKYPKPDRLEIVSIAAILDDAHAKAEPGGFVPIPA